MLDCAHGRQKSHSFAEADEEAVAEVMAEKPVVPPGRLELPLIAEPDFESGRQMRPVMAWALITSAKVQPNAPGVSSGCGSESETL